MANHCLTLQCVCRCGLRCVCWRGVCRCGHVCCGRRPTDRMDVKREGGVRMSRGVARKTKKDRCFGRKFWMKCWYGNLLNSMLFLTGGFLRLRSVALIG